MNYNNMIKIRDDFQTSINILYDLYDDKKIKNFIPTEASIEIIENIILSTSDDSTNRAKILIGAYGRGKSHIILVALSMLINKDRDLFEELLNKIKKINKPLFFYIDEYFKSGKKIFPVIINGNNRSLSQSFLTGIESALKKEGLEKLMPSTNFKAAVDSINVWKEKYKDTYDEFEKSIDVKVETFINNLIDYDLDSYNEFLELYPRLTSGSIFNPYLKGDVIEIYECVTKELCKLGYSGIYIVYDEFSKYLEANISTATIGDIKLLQDLAEKCNRSSDTQMHLLLINHKDISNYIGENLEKEKVDGWRGISGRFTDIHLNNNFSQIYEVISQVICKDETIWDKFKKEYNYLFEDLAEIYFENNFLGYDSKEKTKNIIVECYPLHPATMFMLPRLSEKIAQNERTLFTFLSSKEKFTLNEFINSDKKIFELLTPDYIYDYFEPLFRKEPYTSLIHEIYKLTNNILLKLENNNLQKKVIKTISLIYMIEQYEKLAPNTETIVNIFSGEVYSSEEIEECIVDLINNESLIYFKKSNNYLQLKDRTGIDIKKELDKYVNKLEIKKSYIEILNDVNIENYLYPTKYNDDYEIVRYFDFKFIDGKKILNKNFDIENIFTDLHGDGLVLGIIPSSAEEITLLKEVLKEIKKVENILFILPKKVHKEIGIYIYEYYALLELKENAQENIILINEIDIYIDDLKEVLIKYIAEFIRPETNKSMYILNGNFQKLNRRAQLSNLLSKIAEYNYYKTPIIINEMINQNELTTTTYNSRSRIINGMFETNDDINLGLENSNQDMSILRSTILRNNILIEKNGKVKLNRKIECENLRSVIDEIEKFILTSKEKEYKFDYLYEILIDKKYNYGLKKGVIPLLISSVIYDYKDRIIIKKYGKELKLSSELMNNIEKNPSYYSVEIEHWNEEKTKYVNSLEAIFEDYIVKSEKNYNSFNYLLDAMNRWYMSLPRYAKEVNTIYCGYEKESLKINIKDIKFRNILKRFDNNPRDFLFSEIFKIYEYNDLDLNILNKIIETKNMYDSLLEKLIEKLIEDIKIIFSNYIENKKSLTSIIEDWVSGLEKESQLHLYSNSEENTLEIMANISNNEIIFVRELAKSITGLRIEDWNETTINEFIDNLIKFKISIENYNSKLIEKSKDNLILNNYKFIFVDSDGKELIKTFEKCNTSKRAGLLKNEILNSIDEMGKSITESEKRQVILDILQELSE